MYGNLIWVRYFALDFFSLSLLNGEVRWPDFSFPLALCAVQLIIELQKRAYICKYNDLAQLLIYKPLCKVTWFIHITWSFQFNKVKHSQHLICNKATSMSDFFPCGAHLRACRLPFQGMCSCSFVLRFLYQTSCVYVIVLVTVTIIIFLLNSLSFPPKDYGFGEKNVDTKVIVKQILHQQNSIMSDSMHQLSLLD